MWFVVCRVVNALDKSRKLVCGVCILLCYESQGQIKEYLKNNNQLLLTYYNGAVQNPFHLSHLKQAQPCGSHASLRSMNEGGKLPPQVVLLVRTEG